MLLSVRAYMYLLSCVHSSCNERPTNRSANPIIAHLFLFVIGRLDGFRFYEPYQLLFTGWENTDFDLKDRIYLKIFLVGTAYGPTRRQRSQSGWLCRVGYIQIPFLRTDQEEEVYPGIYAPMPVHPSFRLLRQYAPFLAEFLCVPV